MTDPWSADFDDLLVFSLAMQNKLELSVYHQQKLDNSQTYFLQYIPLWLNPVGLTVHQGKQRININSELPLALPRWLQ